MKKIISVSLFGLLSVTALAQSIDYPELHVEPSASWRLKKNSEKDEKDGTLYMAPLAIAGVTNIIAGSLQFHNYDPHEENSKKTGYLGLASGALSLGTAVYFSYFHKLNRDRLSEIEGIKGESKAEKLRRERLSEEALRDSARLYQKVNWSLAAINIASDIVMRNNARDGQKAAPTIGIATSLLPLLFNHYWASSYSDYKHNKKNIYAPLATVSPVRPEGHTKYVQTLNLTWLF